MWSGASTPGKKYLFISSQLSKGLRVFNVILQGNRVLENFDITATVGYQVAVAYRYTIPVVSTSYFPH